MLTLLNIVFYGKISKNIKARTFDIIVCRFTQDAIRRPSRPGELCIYYMKWQTRRCINKVYYFNNNGDLMCEKLADMTSGIHSQAFMNIQSGTFIDKMYKNTK